MPKRFVRLNKHEYKKLYGFQILAQFILWNFTLLTLFKALSAMRFVPGPRNSLRSNGLHGLVVNSIGRSDSDSVQLLFT